MPTYKNKTGTSQFVDEKVTFKPNEQKELDYYLEDAGDVVNLQSHSPYVNPVLLDTEFITDTGIVTNVDLDTATRVIWIEASGNTEVYRNSLSNTPPLLADSSRILKITQEKPEISQLVIKTLQDGITVKISVFDRRGAS
ncbi:MAG: hypothetical protein KAS32_14185 [Candidatus Peribacteraceae bacterium]|nr:hypothetical protein [Candidatus Peribacteraceae bacterium]